MSDMLTIGIISDTHGRLDERAYAALADCDHIIHAGDIGGPSILRELECLAPVTAVLGNNDFAEYGSAVGRFARPCIGGVRFLVAHEPRDVRVNGLGSAALAPGDPIPQVLIHGHTHEPRIETGALARPAALLLCPGSAFRPRGGFPRCIARMTVEDGRVLSVQVESLDGTVVLSNHRSGGEARRRFRELAEYIDGRYVEDGLHVGASSCSLDARSFEARPLDVCLSEPPLQALCAPQCLEEMLEHLDEPFSTTLLRLIDARGLSDAQVYKRANMSRQLFSKIRSAPDYRPAKRTVMALALALELSPAEADDLLERAGFALSRASKADIIFEYFITRGIYDIFEVNEALYAFDQPLL